MKYLIQQMIGFFIVILTVLIVIGWSFQSLTRQTLVNNYYEQMFSYARSVIVATKDQPENLLYAISGSEKFLKNQKVGMIYFDQNKQLAYPKSEEYQNILNLSLLDKQWENAKKGESFSFTKHYEFDMDVEKDYAVITQPIFSGEVDDEFLGVLMIYRPVSLIEASVKDLTRNLLTAFLVSSLLAIIFSFIFSQYQVNRINLLKKGTSKIANGQLEFQIPVRSGRKLDELDELAVSFNKMAKKLQESDEEIKYQEEQRRRFMADAAHEMRTPLTTINGLLEGISHNMIPESQKEKTVELMNKETKRLIRLVNENLDYEKIRTNQIQMKLVRLNATDILHSVATQLSQKAEEFGDEIIVTGNEYIEVHADYDRFVQVLINITQNAIQFTQNGRIYLTADRFYDHTVITIKDTGIGMTEEEVRNIWERYYKVDPSRKHTKYGESGLGLAIVQQLVRLHEGTIEVTSQKGFGTTFVITFPDHLDEIPT